MPRTINHPALQPLKEKFGNVKFLVGEFRDMITVVVPREHIVAVCTFLRDDPTLQYDMLGELNGVDYLNYPGARHRFGVNYGLVSTPKNNRLWLKVFLDPSQDTSPGKDVRDEDAIEKGDTEARRDEEKTRRKCNYREWILRAFFVASCLRVRFFFMRIRGETWDPSTMKPPVI